MQRSGKFYRKNEADVMELLGLHPTKNSGSGWIEKEDGQSDELICQLKSTDANSIKVSKQDLDTLEYNAMVAHKLPVFAIQFLQSNEVYVIMRPEQLQEIAQYIKTGEVPDTIQYALSGIELSEHEETEPVRPAKVVKSSSSAREQFREEMENKYRKGGKSAI